jgi:2-polyprenyl-3-methyl-5-hydroxy-6-metoxy-1,4-benzoquinol methylase
MLLVFLLLSFFQGYAMGAQESANIESINALNNSCYNARADYWDRMPFADFLPAEILRKHSHSVSMKALDIGSGTGMLAEWLVKQGFDVLCIDPSDEMVQRCRLKGLTTVQTTLQEFSCETKFGLITAVLSLIHVPKKDISNELKRISDWLEPGGTFVLALINGTGEGVREANTDYPRYFS